jgi:hypothetical protein
MRSLHPLIVASALGLALAACERPATPSDAGKAQAPTAASFAYDEADDLSGYYLPTAEVEAGGYVLDHLFLGQAGEFQAWKTGTRNATFAPVMLEFQKSGQSQSIGQGDGPGSGIRVLPTRYAVEGGRLRFEGRAPGVGAVTFDGRIDKGALATAKRNLGGDEAPVVTGRLKVGGQTTDVRLAWYGGD